MRHRDLYRRATTNLRGECRGRVMPLGEMFGEACRLARREGLVDVLIYN
jgi:hypothetical protein